MLAEVIYQICQPNIIPRSCDPDISDSYPVHSSCHKPKDMLNTTSDLGFFSVVYFLFFRQGMSSVPFFADMIFTFFRKLFCYRFSGIGTVCIQCFVFLIKKIYTSVAVVKCCICYRIIGDKLAVRIKFHMILVTIMDFVIFLCPSCICVLLCKLMRIFVLLPFFGDLSVFNFLILITAVALPGCFHKCCHYCSLMCYHSFVFKHCIKHTEQLFSHFCIGKGIFKIPYCLGINYLVIESESKNLIKLSRSLI